MNKWTIKRQILIELLVHPLVLVPAILSSACLAGMWTIDMFTPMLIGTTVGSAIVSLGSFLSRLFLYGEDIAETVVLKNSQAKQIDNEKDLDDLYQKLLDDDGSAANLLIDLRSIKLAFVHKELDSVLSAVNIKQTVDELFEQSIKSLRYSLVMSDTIKSIQSTQMKNSFKKRKKALLLNVSDALEKLGDIMANIDSINVDEISKTALDTSHLLDELKSKIDLAQSVKDKMYAFGDQEPLSIKHRIGESHAESD